MGLLEVLTLIFITLKLMGHIDWSWWWVLSPMWGAFVFYIAAVLALVFGVRKVNSHVRRDWR